MTIKRTVTDAVIAANEDKAKSSTGPKTPKGKSASSRSSRRHDILARAVFLDSDEKRAGYQALWQSWNAHFKPQGPLERLLVEDITNTCWKLAIEESLETKELTRRQQDSNPVLGLFENTLQLPIDACDLPVDHSWNCDRLVVRAVARDEHSNVTGTRQPAVVQNRWVEQVKKLDDSQNRHGGHLEIEAVLGSTLDTLTRYGRTLRNNLYRAIRQMRILRGEEQEE